MNHIITITRLARRLDVAPSVIKRRIKAGLIQPVGQTEQGLPLFSAHLIETYRAAVAQPVGWKAK